MASPEITVSIVSHRQNRMVNALLGDFHRFCARRVVLTLTENVLDDVPLETIASNCSIEKIKNASPKGFGANHNAAFARCRTPFFCVVNPDVRLILDPFGPLLETLTQQRVGVVGPLVRSPKGNIEDSARRYPTPWSLFLKLIRSQPGPDYPTDAGVVDVDWVGGMFMVFTSDAFRLVNGFDESYYLYYEDVDICHRLKATKLNVLFDPRVQVVHDARRASRRNLGQAMHHIASIIRFLSRRYEA